MSSSKLAGHKNYCDLKLSIVKRISVLYLGQDAVDSRMRAVLSTFLLLLSILFGLAPKAFSSDKISDYRPVFKPYLDREAHVKIAIREFHRGRSAMLLSVDPATFETFIVDSGDMATEAKDVSKTPFMRALSKYTARKEGLQNHGITEGESSGKGAFLTVDLCPSRKDLDKGLFESTMGLDKDAPVPVAIAVSGLWIEKHREDLDWVLEKVRSKRLSVTWVNHTYSHPFDVEKPFEKNFLLSDVVDIEKEILAEEALLIENGLTPSPFFRFPGLVSDSRLVDKLKALSLIPIGSNAWLAKGEMPKKGSIILVHGNGNEPPGIKNLLELYSGKKEDFKKGNLKLLPLKEAFSSR